MNCAFIASRRTLLCRTALLMRGILQLQDERTKIAELVSQRMALKQKLSEELQAYAASSPTE